MATTPHARVRTTSLRHKPEDIDPLLAAMLRHMLGDIDDKQFAVALPAALSGARRLLAMKAPVADSALIEVTIPGAERWLKHLAVLPETQTVMKAVRSWDFARDDRFLADAVVAAVTTTAELGALVGACVAYEMLRGSAR